MQGSFQSLAGQAGRVGSSYESGDLLDLETGKAATSYTPGRQPDDECSLRLDQGLYDMMMEQKKGIQPRLALSLLLPALPVSLPSACVHMLNQGLVHGNSFRARLGFPLFLPFLPVAFPSACRHILDQGCIWKPSGRWQTLATDQHRCQFCMSHCPLHNCRCLQHPSNSTTIS